MNDQQQREYDSWHSVCQEARELNIDLTNNGGVLARAIIRWGEELVELTLSSYTNPRTKRLEESRKTYPNIEERAKEFRKKRKV